MNVDYYTILTLLVVLTAFFSYLNFRYIKLPPTIGIMIMSLITSLVIVVVGYFYPAFLLRSVALIKSVDLETILMRIMLSFLLFAGAMHVNASQLKKEIVPIIAFSTIGVLLSTAFIGVAMYFLLGLFNFHIPVIYCLLFGALISPTDPIAVLGILKKANIPSSLEIKITGESLFNDGIGVVVFISLFEIARMGTENLSMAQIGWIFLREAGGGIIWGGIIGFAGFYLLRSIDNYQVEVMITLAMVMGGYLFAFFLHISGPLAMVVAGIITGNQGMREAMSDKTRDYLVKFWELIDEILNALLFILIGFEMLIISLNHALIWVSLIAIPVILLARWISVSIPIFFLSFRRTFEKNTIAVLAWGGLRGGISVALALSLPAGMHREEFLAVTYVVVIFSIIVQGLTIGKLARKLIKPAI
jgi:CPA1 family monovalent cation:H+ antiporter